MKTPRQRITNGCQITVSGQSLVQDRRESEDPSSCRRLAIVKLGKFVYLNLHRNRIFARKVAASHFASAPNTLKGLVGWKSFSNEWVKLGAGYYFSKCG